jgi:hypothetical protein
MEPEDSLPCSQEPTARPYTELDQSTSTYPISIKIRFNNILSTISSSSLRYLSFWISHRNSVNIPLLPHACYMPWTSHSRCLDHSNHTWRSVRFWSTSLCSFLQPPGTHYLHLTLLYTIEYYWTLTEVLDCILQEQLPRQRWLVGCPKGNVMYFKYPAIPIAALNTKVMSLYESMFSVRTFCLRKSLSPEYEGDQTRMLELFDAMSCAPKGEMHLRS